MKKPSSTKQLCFNTPPINIQHQKGVTLIEILVTVIILAIGLLGVAGMQNTSIKFSYESYLRSQGAFLSYDLMDRIRANPNKVYELSFGQQPSASNCIGTAKNCTPDDLLAADLAEWYTEASAIFPGSQFELQEEGGEYTLSIRWDDRYETDELDSEVKRFDYNFKIQ